MTTTKRCNKFIHCICTSPFELFGIRVGFISDRPYFFLFNVGYRWSCWCIHNYGVSCYQCCFSQQRLIKMNMPLNEDNTVSFSTTLFALIRTSLNIKLRGNMNANDTELRKMIKNIWPKTSEKVLNKLIPKQSGESGWTKLHKCNFTVKVLFNWRQV